MKKRWDFKNENDIKKIIKKAKLSYTKFTKKTDGSDDCAQEIVEHYFSGKGKHQTIDQSVIDYLRRSSGDKRLPGYSQRKNLENSYSIESGPFKNLSDGCIAIHMENRLDAERIIGLANHWKRAIMMLYFMEGYGQSEIGNFFGVSESRVHQWIKDIQEKIQRKIKSKKSDSKTRRFETTLQKETEGNKWSVEQFENEKMERSESFEMESYSQESF